MSPLLPRKLSVQQGTTAAPVKTPAEDWRLNDGALWTPGGAQLQERSGIVAGAGPSTGGEPLAVTAAAGGVFTIQPGRFFVQGSAALQGGYLGTVDQVTTRTIAGADLPASGSFKAGYLGVKVYDQVYSDTQDGADVIYLVGASAATANSAAFPALPTSFLQLRAFTVDSTGTVTFGSYLPPFTVPRGGVLPVRATDATPGAFVGQYRDQPSNGLERWDGGKWATPLTLGQWTVPLGAQGGTGYGFGLPLGTWGDLPGLGFTGVVVPPGRNLEVELQIPYMQVGSGAAGRLRFVSGAGYGTIQGEQRFGTSSGVTIFTPVFMRAYYVGDGTAQQVKVHGYCEAGSVSVNGFDASGPVLRYRIS